MPLITFSDTDTTLEVPSGAALLDACEESDAPVPFACTAGACGTCLIQLEAGADQVSPMDADEERTVRSSTELEGARLACQLTVLGDITIKAIG